MSEFERAPETERADLSHRPRRGVQVLGQWMIVAGILAAVVGLVAQIMVAEGAGRVWNLFGDPLLARADRMPAADFGLVIVGVAAGIVLVMLGGLILAVRGRSAR